MSWQQQTGGQQKTTAPDRSQYSPGEPYGASREPGDTQAVSHLPNGEIHVLRSTHVLVWDRDGNPVRAGIYISETDVHPVDSRCLSSVGNRKGGGPTDAYGGLRSDLWIRNFSCENGFAKFTQTFTSPNGKNLTFPAATLDAKGNLDFNFAQNTFFR